MRKRSNPDRRSRKYDSRKRDTTGGKYRKSKRDTATKKKRETRKKNHPYTSQPMMSQPPKWRW